MSLSDLVSGGADCGPSNALSQLGKRFGQDRSSQMDRFDGPGVGGSGSSTPSGSGGAFGMRTGLHQPRAGMHANPLMQQQHGGAGPAFDMAPLRDGLPQMSRAPGLPHQQQQQQPRPNPAAFEAAFSHRPAPAPGAQGAVARPAPAAPAWAADFMMSNQASAGAPAVTAGAPKFMQARQMVSDQQHAQHSQQPMFQSYQHQASPMLLHQQHQQHSMMMHQQQPIEPLYATPPPQQQQNHAQSQQQWASAFSAMEKEQQAIASQQQQQRTDSGAPQPLNTYTPNPLLRSDSHPTQLPPQLHEEQRAHAENSAADADALAAAAGKLIETVSHDRSSKFQRSNFLELMRRLRDRQAGIQGADIVDTPDGVALPASSNAMSTMDKGKARAMDHDDGELHSGADSELTAGVMRDAAASSSMRGAEASSGFSSQQQQHRPANAQEAYARAQQMLSQPGLLAEQQRQRLQERSQGHGQAQGLRAGQVPVIPGPSSLQNELEGRAELAEMWAEEDARSAALEQGKLAESRERLEREEQARRQAFLGDGGDVEAREREDLFAELEFEDREKERERQEERAGNALSGIAEAARYMLAQQEQEEREEQAANALSGIAEAAKAALAAQERGETLDMEDDEVEDADAAEVARYRGLNAGVAGADPTWQEAGDVEREEDKQSEASDHDFVGRGWFGSKGRGVAGAQNTEWDRLQADWDAWDATAAGLQRAATASGSQAQAAAYDLRPAQEYSFQQENPYLSRHHAGHAMQGAESLDSLLENEARVQSAPTDASAWFDLGVKQQENEREGQAISALRKAIELDPSMRDAWLALAVSYTNENDRTQAFEAIEQWIQSSQQYAEVVRQHRAAGGAASLQNMTPLQRHSILTETLIALARYGSQAGDVDADVQIALGVLFNASEEYDKAVDCFATALSVRPDDWLLYNRLGATLSNSGRSGEAIQYYHHALSLQPGFVRCHFNLSISCLNLKVSPALASGARCSVHSLTQLPLDRCTKTPRSTSTLRSRSRRRTSRPRTGRTSASAAPVSGRRSASRSSSWSARTSPTSARSATLASLTPQTSRAARRATPTWSTRAVECKRSSSVRSSLYVQGVQ